MNCFGLIGNPISHSKSPALFSAGYGGRYSYDLIERDNFVSAWQCFLKDYRAINVTTPFKSEAFSAVLKAAVEGRGSVSGPCFKIKAANLIVKDDDGSLHAYNSDFSGVILAVAEAYFPGITKQCTSLYGPQARIRIHQFVRGNLEALFGRKPQALIVGCGGAGRAAAVATSEMGFDTALMNRTNEKAQALADSLPEYGFICVPMSEFTNAVRECDLVIYTIPGEIPCLDSLTLGDFAGERDSASQPSKVIFEANYRAPVFTGGRLAALREAGCRYLRGQEWLLGQAIAGYALMTDECPDAEAMSSVISQASSLFGKDDLEKK